MKEWINIIDKEYLSDFLPEGGGSVKFLAGPEERAAEVSSALDDLARDRKFVRVGLDGAATKLNRIDHVFFEVARQIDWAGLAQRFVAEGFRDAGWTFEKSPEGFDPASIAMENGIEETEVRAVFKNWLQSLYHDYEMSQEFRLAMLQLCRAQIAGLGSTAVPVVFWLRGELSRIGELRQAKIFQKIGRHNARLTLQSLTHWLRRNAQPGLLLTIDIARCLENVKRLERKEGIYYSSAALTEVYEMLRQLIDGASELKGTLGVVFAPQALLSDEKRGVDRYQALKMRIFDDVRNRGVQNVLAPLVRLAGEAA